MEKADTTPRLMLADEAVYRRTGGGNRALVYRCDALPAQQWRLLAAFTGLTPLRDIAELLQEEVDLRLAIHGLLSAGLIQLVPSAELQSGDTRTGRR